MSTISIIVAMTENRVIGQSGQLPWHLPADLKHFKMMTMGKPIVMGRKTFDSIGKPLPNRINMVLTTSHDFKAEGVKIFHSIDDILNITHEFKEWMIIGGAEIYRLFLPYTSKLYITRVHAEIKGDTYFPDIDFKQWTLKDSQFFNADEKNLLDFSFETWIK